MTPSGVILGFLLGMILASAYWWNRVRGATAEMRQADREADAARRCYCRDHGIVSDIVHICASNDPVVTKYVRIVARLKGR